MNSRTGSHKDLQTLPQKPRPVQDAGGLNDQNSSDPDAVLSIDSGFGNNSTIIEDHAGFKRNANWGDILYHSVTAMVGAGVLGLPAAMAYLGWAGGIIFLVFSIWVSWHTYKLLVYMHEVPDLDSKGGIRRLDRYDQLAEYIWGKGRGKKILLPFQLLVLVGIGITYCVVGGQNLHAFAQGIAPSGGHVPGMWVFIIIFGGLQLFLSMLPSLHDARLVSLLGALMSAAYCIIAIAMSATVKHGPGNQVNYDPAKVPHSSLSRVMGIFNAMTTVFFAYGGHNVALEIQATIGITEKYPSTVRPMMKGVHWTFLITGLCYFGVSILGFWAFGTDVGDNVLLAFKAGPHHWVVTMATMLVVVHVGAAFQVYTQPIFSLIEAAFRKRNRDINIYLQFAMRVAYVVACTIVALLIPFFGSLMGFFGAVAITPTTFTFPPLLWIMYKRPHRWSFDWTANWFLVWITGLLGILGTIGALYSIVDAWSTFHIFAN